MPEVLQWCHEEGSTLAPFSMAAAAATLAIQNHAFRPRSPSTVDTEPPGREDEMLLTFGHGTASAEQMTGLLRGAGVAGLIDIRTAPGSRRHPHVARAELQRWLPEAGISYRWDKRLGGFRRPAPDSPDVALHGAAAEVPSQAQRKPGASRHCVLTRCPPMESSGQIVD